MAIVKEYTNGETTIVWKPEQCIHSEKCWRGLPQVFKPKDKPWINPEGVDSETIINQVNQCPSGALSAYLNAEGAKSNDMEKVKAQVLENGPLMVTGSCEVVLKDGTTEVKDKVAFCRCGHSANKPYCDGAHKAQGFQG